MNAPAKVAHSKPHVNLGMLGQVDHGKTSLTAAITKVLAKTGGATFLTCEQLDNAPEARARGITFSTTHVEYQTANRHYTHVDCPSHGDHVKNMIAGAAQLDGAILVVSLDGPMPQTRTHIQMARQVGIPGLVVFLNKVDSLEDLEACELVEQEIRDLLKTFEFPGDTIPIVSGSALKALEGDMGEWGEPAIQKLLEVVDSYIPTPTCATDKPFLLAVEDVVSSADDGTVVKGRVERGTLTLHEEIEVVGLRPTQKAVVTSLALSEKQASEGREGDTLIVRVRGLKREDLARGQVLAKPGSIKAHTRFKALLYVLSKDEGGRYTPFSTGYGPHFHFHTSDVTGTVKLPEDVKMVMPGEDIAIEVELSAPVAMEKALRFIVREGGRSVGVGVVSEVLG